MPRKDDKVQLIAMRVLGKREYVDSSGKVKKLRKRKLDEKLMAEMTANVR